MAKKRTHVLDNFEEFTRYLYACMVAYNTTSTVEIAEKLRLKKKEMGVVSEVLLTNARNLVDNIKCACGEYHALVEEGQIPEQDQYKPKTDKEHESVDDLRTAIMAQIKEIEETFGNGSGNNK